MSAMATTAPKGGTISGETSSAPDEALSVRGVSKKFGRRIVLKDVTFGSKAGSLVGVVGENGAGKTTLLKILAGLLPPTRGQIVVRGRVGYCPQEVMLNEALTVRQHLEYFAAAYHIPDFERGKELVALLGYDPYMDRRVAELSGGTRQKLNLTISLMHRPSVLLLDEPYQGFDWETYLRFWDLAEMLKNEGATVVIISHLVFDQSRFGVVYDLRDGVLQRQGSVVLPVAQRVTP